MRELLKRDDVELREYSKLQRLGHHVVTYLYCTHPLCKKPDLQLFQYANGSLKTFAEFSIQFSTYESGV
jgi:hypothetical protein